MSSSDQTLYEDTSSTLGAASIPIPHELRFAAESLKSLTLNSLTQTNYPNWFTQVEEIFDAAEYTEFLNPNTPIPPQFLISEDGHQNPNPRYRPFNQITKTLLTALRSTISPPLQSLILRHKTIAQFSTTLATHFKSQTYSRITLLQTELYTLRMRDNDLSTFIDRMRSIRNQLEAVDCPIGDAQIITLILNGLPTTYRAFVLAFRLISHHHTLESFLSLLYTKEVSLQTADQHNSTDHTQALLSTANRPSSTST